MTGFLRFGSPGEAGSVRAQSELEDAELFDDESLELDDDSLELLELLDDESLDPPEPLEAPPEDPRASFL